jgi:cobalt-zinc-cadmium efflux system protein
LADHDHNHDHAAGDHAAGDHAAHDHASHGHSHAGHHHGPVSHDRAFAIGVGLNTAFVAAEMFFGFTANSVALIADAIHNLGDVLSLLLAWGAAALTRMPPSGRRTYGWGRTSILASLANAAILLVSIGAIGLEAIQRFANPAPVAEVTVMVVAGIGILINGATALMFMRGRAADLNLRATYVHMVGDAAVSFGVVLSAGIIMLTGWLWFDPLTSLAIVAVIGISTWSLLRESVSLVLDQVPPGIEMEDVQQYLTGLPGVSEMHDLHIWGLSTTESALTVHLVCTQPDAELCRPHEVAAELRRRFGIGHVTVQMEHGAEAEWCRLRPEEVV